MDNIVEHSMRGPCMAKHAAQRRHQGVNRRTAGDDGRHTTHRTHITPHILISYSPYGTACFLCTLHQFNGIFTLACSPTDANRSNGQRNQPEPSALLPARSSELIACCSACSPTYAPLACSLLARSHANVNRSNGQRNQPEPSALLPARSSELLAGCDELLMGRTHITHTSHASRLLSSSLSQHLLPPRSRN